MSAGSAPSLIWHRHHHWYSVADILISAMLPGANAALGQVPQPVFHQQLEARLSSLSQ